MKQKIIGLIVVAVLIGLGVFLYFQSQKPELATYRDEANKVEFQHPESWQVSSSSPFITVLSDPSAEKPMKIIITVDPNPIFAKFRGLVPGQAEEIKIGDKTLLMTHKEEAGQTFTHLYLQEAGRLFLFEISPWQTPNLNKETQTIIKSFKTFWSP